MMKPSLQLRIGQQLTMTPQLQQAIRLLQLPSLDLQAHVRETLETNVMLEAEEELSAKRRHPKSCVSPRTPPQCARNTPNSTALDGGRRSARGARGRNRRRSLGRTDERAVGHLVVRRRRPQRRFQRPAFGNSAGTADRPARARPFIRDRPCDRPRHHRRDHRRRLPLDDLENIRASLLPEIDVALAEVERVLRIVQGLSPPASVRAI
jgi:DNA-directed RNA polymerase specialized sigma54-like protein